MDATNPALRAARLLARARGARIVPLAGEMAVGLAGGLPNLDGAIVLVDQPPSDERLAALAAALPRVEALVLWCADWDEAIAVETLGRHGLEHGTVELLSDPEPGALSVLVATEEAASTIAPTLAQRQKPFQPLAIMPAYNEQDVIYHAIEALVSEGVDVYLIDHASTDGTADAARPWLGRGLVHIERFPEEAGYAERNQREMVWRDILRRVQEVSGERGADWYLFVNADEFREAPWPGVTLAEGLREVDELGYNAVNFELFDFRAIDDSFVDGEDVRYFLRHYEPPGRYNLLQVKAWKRQEQPVDIVTHGGHDLLFAGKCVFPVPFILRHYPIRSSAHGRRKVLGERLPRFAAEERAGGWHVQYDHYGKDSDYLHDPATLAVWDASRARAELLARTLQTLLLSLCLGGAKPTGHGIDGAALVGWLTRRGLPPASAVELQQAQERLALAARGTPAPGDDPAVDLIARDLSVALEANASVAGNPLLARQLAEAREALAGGAPARELAASV